MTGAIFDVDGTLLDSMPIWEDVSVRYLKSLGVEAESNLPQKLERMSVEEGAAYIKENYGLRETEEEIAAVTLKIVEDFYYNEAPLKPGVQRISGQAEGRKYSHGDCHLQRETPCGSGFAASGSP